MSAMRWCGPWAIASRPSSASENVERLAALQEELRGSHKALAAGPR